MLSKNLYINLRKNALKSHHTCKGLTHIYQNDDKPYLCINNYKKISRIVTNIINSKQIPCMTQEQDGAKKRNIVITVFSSRRNKSATCYIKHIAVVC